MSNNDLGAQRQELVEYLRQQLIGPAAGEREILVEPPTKRYAMGILFPQGAGCSEAEVDEERDEQPSVATDEGESPISLAFQRLPASMGVSFFMSGEPQIKCDVWASRYVETEDNSTGEIDVTQRRRRESKWIRVPITEAAQPETITIEIDGANQSPRTVCDGRARVDVQWRKVSGGLLVTVTMLNAQTGGERPDPSKCLCQTGFRCYPVNGAIRVYPHHIRLSLDDEDEDLALIYREKVPFAVGHGCAAVWEDRPGGAAPGWVMAEVMPSQEVKPITTALPAPKNSPPTDQSVLRLQYLMDDGVSPSDLAAKLNGFIDGYAAWIDDVRETKVPEGYERARERILDRLNEALTRMRRGVRSICDEAQPQILSAFRWAQLAMLQQMIHSGLGYAGTIRSLGSGQTDPPDYTAESFSEYAWRPFQLAFQLLAINGLIDRTAEDRHERELVDLIWFPTGGGKTEAYLALAAFEIIHRRLKDPSKGAGTAVIKRYTLRLLTTQQFERAASLVTALELIRKSRPKQLGESPIRLGLWVGGDTSPNKYSTGDPARPGAKELLEAVVQEDEPRNPFQLQKCPWCGTRIIPEHRSADPAHYGVEATASSFRFFCPDTRCRAHDAIPVSVVDEDLYDRPPSLVIGTIDKFARMVWDPDSRHFFVGKSEGRDPPSLIIQDELHLISGPLGTIAGVYESAIDTVIRTLGKPAKVIAATATIRRAAEQVERLYARPVRVFPPSGIDADDSYYSRVDHSAPGRLYVGVMAQGHTRMYSLVMTAAALVQAPLALDFKKSALDAYWTQVIYHNSRRELGKTMTLARDDVGARIEALESVEDRRRLVRNVEELSANVKGPDIPRVLERLKQSVDSGDAVDILPCTNMISVGVDVSRLGMMLMYGQPKNTSEYIQASSRVGRDPKRPPGLVVTLYAPTKPRDRSHYEAFKSYHQALYRYVEPTSVTPFAPPSRDRALHAALVIVMRHVGGLIDNSSASRFTPKDAMTSRLMGELLERMKSAEPREAAEIERHLRTLAEEWAEHAETGGTRLCFNGNTRQFRDLLCTFEDGDKGIWRTLNSMRNVDQESLVRVIGVPS